MDKALTRCVVVGSTCGGGLKGPRKAVQGQRKAVTAPLPTTGAGAARWNRGRVVGAGRAQTSGAHATQPKRRDVGRRDRGCSSLWCGTSCCWCSGIRRAETLLPAPYHLIQYSLCPKPICGPVSCSIEPPPAQAAVSFFARRLPTNQPFLPTTQPFPAAVSSRSRGRCGTSTTTASLAG